MSAYGATAQKPQVTAMPWATGRKVLNLQHKSARALPRVGARRNPVGAVRVIPSALSSARSPGALLSASRLPGDAWPVPRADDGSYDRARRGAAVVARTTSRGTMTVSGPGAVSASIRAMARPRASPASRCPTPVIHAASACAWSAAWVRRAWCRARVSAVIRSKVSAGWGDRPRISVRCPARRPAPSRVYEPFGRSRHCTPVALGAESRRSPAGGPATCRWEADVAGGRVLARRAAL